MILYSSLNGNYTLEVLFFYSFFFYHHILFLKLDEFQWINQPKGFLMFSGGIDKQHWAIVG